MNSVIAMIQQMMSGLGIGPPPDADTMRSIRAANHNNQKVFKAWDLFQALILNGEPANQAMRKAEEAIGVWQEYEDKNWIDPPIPDPPTLPAMPLVPVGFGPRAAPDRLYYAIVAPGPDHARKVVESEPGVMMIFEYFSAAVEKAKNLGEGHTVIACAAQVLGPAEADAEFVGDGREG